MLEEIFGSDGVFAKVIEGFAPRAAQLQMAQAVDSVLQRGGSGLIEAGTGTGKTFAYLVPALLSGRMIVISTGTRNLQDQLFDRDLPKLRAALGVSARCAVLKGRSNYFCRYRFRSLGVAMDPQYAALQQWAQSTASGDLAELGALGEHSALRPRISSTADNCLGAKCPDFSGCHVVKARRAAMAADVVVVNHHLLLSDTVLKDDGFGEVLPSADAVIVDEAHQLPELLNEFFDQRVSSRQLRELADDVLRESTTEFSDLRQCARVLSQLAGELEGCFVGTSGRMPRLDWINRKPATEAVLGNIDDALQQLAGMAKSAAEREEVFAALEDRTRRLALRWRAVTGALEPGSVFWVESSGRGGALHKTPIDAAQGFEKLLSAQRAAWVLTSATLSAAGDFSAYRSRLGLNAPGAEVQQICLESPFDYAQQARLLLPDSLPDPREPAYSASVAQLAVQLIQSSGGGTFVLCTSHRAVEQIAGVLEQNISQTLLVQGQDSRARLVARFASDGNAVLVGTQAFWEGVDVRGRALRMLLIDKLPFAAPGDPVFEARLQASRDRGENPFMTLQLPEAIMRLRQGVGRLIRDQQDRGLLVLCDPRLRGKAYGQRCLAALPAMPRLDLDQSRRWLETL